MKNLIIICVFLQLLIFNNNVSADIQKSDSKKSVDKIDRQFQSDTFDENLLNSSDLEMQTDTSLTDASEVISDTAYSEDQIVGIDLEIQSDTTFDEKQLDNLNLGIFSGINTISQNEDANLSYIEGINERIRPPCHRYVHLRHIEKKGIGYDKGYTTLEMLSFRSKDENDVYPFLDARVHYFNDNRAAANFGIGYRLSHPDHKKAYGVNLYYDYRFSPCRHSYHQIGIGWEKLFRVWDLRLNGYFPINKRYRFLKCDFNEFTDDYRILRRKYEVAMRGVNFEVAAKTWFDDYFLYLAAGPYYYGGKTCRDTFGGKIRLRVQKSYLRVEGIVSFDRIFNTRVQGLISLHFPIGCPKEDNLKTILAQPIDRHEIIVLDQYCKWEWNY